MTLRRLAVLGAGSWGTTFAKVLVDAGREVTLWARRADVAESLAREHRNPDYLPDVLLPDTLAATCDAREALRGADGVVFAVPSQTLRAKLTEWRDSLPPDATLISLAKGVELASLKRMSEVITEVTGVAAERIAVISGPNLAKEIAAEQPTATVVACTDHDRAVAVQQACHSGYFRPYTNTDVIGCEIAAAGKNVVALACGLAAGLGIGDNAVASLITRGLAEISRLGTVLGGRQTTFAGLAGIGDLVATCTSSLSRNRTFGERLGWGETIRQAQAATHGQVAEGAKSCSSLRQLADRCGVEMPITDGVYRVCYEGLSAAALAVELLGRRTRPE